MGFLKYIDLFSVKMTNDFYTIPENTRKDFAVLPTQECAEFLRNSGSLFRNTEQGFKILFKADNNDDPILSIDSPTRFVFLLGLKNKTEFLNFSDLDIPVDVHPPPTPYASTKVAYYRNPTLTTALLDYELLDFLRSDVFTYDFELTGSPADVIVKFFHEDDTVNPVVTYTLVNVGTDGFYHRPVDLRGKKRGKYIIKVRNTADTSDLKTETVYIDPAIAAQNIFGIIAIDIDQNTSTNPPTLPGGGEYEVAFSKRKSKWKYFFIKKSQLPFNLTDLRILDGGSVYTFANPVSAPQINGYNAVYILSNQEIPFTEDPKKDLDLFINPDLTNPIKEDLPNPTLINISAESTLPSVAEITRIYVYV